MSDAPYLNCDGCRGSLGRAGCPTHRQNASVTIGPSVQWSSSEPVLTHCIHGLDLRLYPRCFLCNPESGWLHDAEVRMEVRMEGFAAGMAAGEAAERERIRLAVEAIDPWAITDSAGYRIDSADAMRRAVLAIIDEEAGR